MSSTREKIALLKNSSDKPRSKLIEVPKDLREQFLNQDVLRAWVGEKFYNQLVLIEYLQTGQFRVNDTECNLAANPNWVCWWKGAGTKAEKIIEIMKKNNSHKKFVEIPELLGFDIISELRKADPLLDVKILWV